MGATESRPSPIEELIKSVEDNTTFAKHVKETTKVVVINQRVINLVYRRLERKNKCTLTFYNYDGPNLINQFAGDDWDIGFDEHVVRCIVAYDGCDCVDGEPATTLIETLRVVLKQEGKLIYTGMTSTLDLSETRSLARGLRIVRAANKLSFEFDKELSMLFFRGIRLAACLPPNAYIDDYLREFYVIVNDDHVQVLKNVQKPNYLLTQLKYWCLYKSELADEYKVRGADLYPMLKINEYVFYCFGDFTHNQVKKFMNSVLQENVEAPFAIERGLYEQITLKEGLEYKKLLDQRHVLLRALLGF